jgi:6-phosphogluconolactonase
MNIRRVFCALAFLLFTGFACSGGGEANGGAGGAAAGSGGSSGVSGSGPAGHAVAGGGGQVDGSPGAAGGASAAGSSGGSSTSGGGIGGATVSTDGGEAGGTDAGGTGGTGLPPNVFLYVSGYNDSNIAVYRFNTVTGGLISTGSAAAGTAPTYSVAASSGRFLYVDDEIGSATITAYGIGANGALTKMNTVKTGGAGTAHLSISPDGKWIVAADYDSDSVSVLALNADGSVGAISDRQLGCPSAHHVQFDSSGKFMLAACKSDAGKDAPRILQFGFAAGKLTPNTPAAVMFGADPRHMTFGLDRRHLYVITEDSNQLFWFDYDSTTGRISNPQMMSALDTGGKVGAGGHIAFGGNDLYVANRSDNSIGIFSVDSVGKPRRVAWQRVGAVDVREFSFDPSGKYLIVANQMASRVTVFGVDAGTGQLTPAGSPISTNSQASAVTIVALP